MSSSTDGSCGAWMTRETDGFLGLDRDVLALRVLGAGGSMAVLDSEKGTTPARRAISCSPNCQCMASAALQGIAISSATLDHISALNLRLSDVSLLSAQILFCSVVANVEQGFFQARLYFGTRSQSIGKKRKKKKKKKKRKKKHTSHIASQVYSFCLHPIRSCALNNSDSGGGS